MGNSQVYAELKEIRKLKRRGVAASPLEKKYKKMFKKLSPLENTVMTDCYIYGLSYADCGRKIFYCERHVKRIVRASIKQLSELERGS